MAPSIESKPDRTDLSTEEVPTFPTVQEMNSWDEKKVLRWIQQRKLNLLKDNNLKKFNEAEIIGRAFLLADFEFFKDCGLSRGASLILNGLVDEFKKDKLSDQTVGGKRKGDEIDSSELSIPPKRIRREDPLWESATRAREQRELIRKFITDLNSSSDQHSKSVHPLPGAVDKLSDPTFERKLAFPFIGRVPERFKMDNKAEQNWPYVGRMMFRKLVEELEMVRESPNYSTVWLYGTQGYGKSHLLAALVCYLAAQDERIVYIPDCREWLRNPVGYLKAAMLFAWADDITTQEEIETLVTKVEIEAFFSRQKNVLVVGDQLNALTESNSPSEETKDRANLYWWLMRFTAKHTAVFSSSASYREFLERSKEQTSNWVVPVYGGLDRTEMDQWWIRHSDIDKGGYKQRDVEDVTGCIPLLLDKCVVGKKIDLNVTYLRDICHEAVDFVQKFRTRTDGIGFYWQWYTEAVKACISHQQVPSGWTEHPDLIDHRYFYRRDNDIGENTCGLIRDAVAEQLLMWEVNFADTDFLTSLRMFTTNPSVTGFMIESAVLSSIRSHGLAIGANIKRPMKVRLFADLFNIATDITGEPVLYCPKKFNHPAIDGIIVLIEPNKPIKDYKKEKKRQKLHIFPLQITPALSDHKDSHAQFFDHYYDKWAKDPFRL